MFRIDHPTAAASLPALGSAGTPGFFAADTVVTKDWFNQYQEEMIAVIVAAGLSPNKGTLTQLRDAIRLLSREQATRGALLARAATQSIPNDTETAITWPTPERQTETVWASGSPTLLTIPSGVTLVRLVGQVTFAANATGSRKARILKNGTMEGVGLPAVRTLAAGGTDVTVIPLAGAIVPVEAGDTLDVRVTQDSGGALNIQATNTWLSIELLK